MSERDLNPAQAGGVDWVRPLRYLWRTPWLLIHVFVGLPATLVAIRFGTRRDPDGDCLRDRAIRWWSATLCRVFGVRVQAVGQRPEDPVLVVANHMSWLDIEVLHGLWALSFVAKAEIENWPLIGYLATAGGTVYHRRGCGDSREAVAGAMIDRLREGASVAIFPEGRTGPGSPVLPFHGRLLVAAVETGCPIQPVAIRYSRDGVRSDAIPFTETENFLTNLLRVLGEPPTVAEVHFLEPLSPDRGRKDLAQAAQAEVAAVVER